jgi:AI-2E family transporter
VQVLTSALVGTAVGIGLWLVGLNQAAMWGVSAGVLNSIPYFGTIIVTVALALVAFLQFGTLEMVIVVAGAFLDKHRRLSTHAMAYRLIFQNEQSRCVSITAVLGLALGRIGNAVGRPDHDGH